MQIADIVGYCAAIFVILTFWMKTMVPLRVAGIASNFLFIAYGYLGAVYPPLLLHVVLLPLNLVRLRQMLKLVSQVRAAMDSDLNMDWLKPFSSSRGVRAGAVLFRKGDTATNMFFVVSGRLRLAESGIDIQPGQIVGELGLLAPGQARTQTLICTEDSHLLQITYEQVKQLYFQNPQFGFYFLQLTARRLFENIARLERELAARAEGAASTRQS
jgi:CRP/FNR family cyclic AMP-dependent transcriptional regulator